MASSIANSLTNEEKTNVGLLPNEDDILKAYKETSTNYHKTRELLKMYQIVNRTERDLLTSPFINPSMRGNIMKEQFQQIGNALTDWGQRAISMSSWMIKEGSWDAYSYDHKEGKLVYDVKKDKRFYTNGKQSVQQKAIMDGLVTRLQTQNLLDRDKTIPDRGHDWILVNDHLKWYGNKFVVGGYDNTVKTLMGVSFLGAAFSQYRYFSYDKFFNAGLYAGTRWQNAGAEWRAVQDENGNWISVREQMQIEGAYQSLGKAITDLKTYIAYSKDMKALGPIGWYKEQSFITRYNIASSMLRVMTFAGLAFAVMGMASDDQDKKFKWIYTDILVWMSAGQWMKNPIPLVTAVLQIGDVVMGRRNMETMERFAGPYRDVKGYIEVLSGDSENE